MKNSLTSMSKDFSSGTKTDESPEESSWTFYFEDFLCNLDEPTSYSSDNESPSLISDAASPSASMKKVMGDNDKGLGFSLGRSYSKSLGFKKRKTGAVVEEEFEDTAISPVNSPKQASYFSQLDQRRKDKEHTDISEEKVGAFGQADGRSDHSIVGDRDYTELKKRGLRLVPVSMLADYLR